MGAHPGRGQARFSTAASKLQFHVIGDAMVDVLASGMQQLPSTWGEDADAAEIDVQAGGSAFNTAMHLASILHGGPWSVFFHGCVGSDTFGSLLQSKLEQAGVVPCLTRLSDAPTGSCIVLSGDAGRSFVTCYGAASILDATHIQGLASAIENGPDHVHVHFAGFYSYGPLRWEASDFIEDIRRRATLQNIKFTVSADINGSEASQVAGFDSVLPALDLFKGNRQEGEAVLGSVHAGQTLELLAESLAAGSRCSIVTDGPGGAAFCGPEGNPGRVGTRQVLVQDSTGAGDACAAGLLASWANGDDLGIAASRGCAAGTANCTRIGGCSKPVTTAEIDALLVPV